MMVALRSAPRLALASLLLLACIAHAAGRPYALGARRRELRAEEAAAPFQDPAPDVLDEKELACYVKDLPAVKGFACKVVYQTLRRALDLAAAGEMDREAIVENLQEERADSYNQSTYVTKPGLSAGMARKAVAAAQAAADAGASDREPTPEFSKLCAKAGFHSLMGSYYPFTVSAEFIEGSIKASPALEEKVFDHIASAFLLDREKIDWEQVDDLIDSTNGQFLLLDALQYLSDQPKSLYRHNALNLPYIRTKRTDAVPDWQLADPEEVATCHSDLLLNQSDRVVQGNTWYSVDDSSFYSELLARYNRSHLAGPSGSAILAHTLYFDLLGNKDTPKDAALLLSAVAGDYVPFYHTLTEILMSYSFEMGIPYTLDMDPVEWVKEHASQYWEAADAGKEGAADKP